MDTFRIVIDHLASPPWLFALAVVLFFLCRGSKLPWTIGGGAGLLLLTAAGLGLGLNDPEFRRLLLHPERLPVAVLLLSTATVLWLEMHRDRRSDAETSVSAEAQPTGFTAAEVVAATVIGLIMILCAAVLPLPFGNIASSSSQPALIKPPWFLIGLQELRHYFAPWWATVGLPLLYVAGLLGLPYLEAEKDSADPRVRGLFLFSWCFLWLWPLAVGALLRGPHWNAFGPFEVWDATRPAMPAPLTLSQHVWIRWLGIPEPTWWWLRELPGILLIVGCCTLVLRQPKRLRLTRELAESYRESLGAWRFYAGSLWLLAVLIILLKLISRWLLGIGDWIYLPELALRF